jgi:hypothetical protein
VEGRVSILSRADYIVNLDSIIAVEDTDAERDRGKRALIYQSLP